MVLDPPLRPRWIEDSIRVMTTENCLSRCRLFVAIILRPCIQTKRRRKSFTCFDLHTCAQIVQHVIHHRNDRSCLLRCCHSPKRRDYLRNLSISGVRVHSSNSANGSPFDSFYPIPASQTDTDDKDITRKRTGSYSGSSLLRGVEDEFVYEEKRCNLHVMLLWGIFGFSRQSLVVLEGD